MMSFRQIHGLLSFTKLLKLLIGIAIGIQLIVISYNHISGYYILDGYQHFLLRMLRGSMLSLLAAFLIAYPDLFIIHNLNKVASWGKSSFKRIAIQLSFTITIAVLISVLVTLFANWIKAYTEDLLNVLINNALIYIVVNILLMTVLEAWIYFIESDRAKRKADHLQEELSQIKFEVLKSQINPHFMFNSLNVLSGLIKKDASKAEQFIDEFSQIYRYVLETIEQPAASLSKELEFMRSYLFLQQIRYGDALSFSINISADLLQWVLPPLSLQVVLENAIKHNIVNEAKPLKIEIFNEGSVLVIRNNMQAKISGHSTGLGLTNLSKRYAMISKQEPVFTVEDNQYIAKLPLINTEIDEGIDY